MKPGRCPFLKGGEMIWKIHRILLAIVAVLAAIGGAYLLGVKL